MIGVLFSVDTGDWKRPGTDAIIKAALTAKARRRDRVPRRGRRPQPDGRRDRADHRRRCRARSRAGDARPSLRQPTVRRYASHARGVAQPGRAPRLGRRGRPFKSARPDQFTHPAIPPTGRKAVAGVVSSTMPLLDRADYDAALVEAIDDLPDWAITALDERRHPGRAGAARGRARDRAGDCASSSIASRRCSALATATSSAGWRAPTWRAPSCGSSTWATSACASSRPPSSRSVSGDRESERELVDEIARLDAEIVVLQRIDTLSERAQADLSARKARRAELAERLAELRR